MKLSVSPMENGLLYVTLSGRMDLDGTNQIYDPFSYQVTSKKAAVLVDMSQVNFVASIGMRLLLTSARALESRDGKMGLIGLNDSVKDVFLTAGIDQLIPIYDDIDTAASELTSED